MIDRPSHRPGQPVAAPRGCELTACPAVWCVLNARHRVGYVRAPDAPGPRWCPRAVVLSRRELPRRRRRLCTPLATPERNPA